MADIGGENLHRFDINSAPESLNTDCSQDQELQRLGDDGSWLPRGISSIGSLIVERPVVDRLPEHSCFLDSPRVVADITEVLRGKATDTIDGRH